MRVKHTYVQRCTAQFGNGNNSQSQNSKQWGRQTMETLLSWVSLGCVCVWVFFFGTRPQHDYSVLSFCWSHGHSDCIIVLYIAHIYRIQFLVLTLPVVVVLDVVAVVAIVEQFSHIPVMVGLRVLLSAAGVNWYLRLNFACANVRSNEDESGYL